MRVTHVITRLIVGGAQENTVLSVLGLSRKPGLEVDLISGPSHGPEGTLEPAMAAQPGALRVLPDLVRPVHPWKDWLAWRRLTTQFRGTRPDIVHTHSGKAGVIGRLAAARARVPIIVHTIHGPSFGAFQGSLPNLVFTNAERIAARVTSHFVVVADAMRDQYLAAGIGQPEQFSKILSGFALEPFLGARNDPAFRTKLGLAPDDIVIGKVARIFKLKGYEDLFSIAPELIRKNNRIKLLLVGDGPWRNRFEAEARDHGIEGHVVFAGLVPPDQVARFVGVMDILVHLSAREGLPRALPQALAAAKPVVAYDCDGAKEVCFQDRTGFLVKPGDRTEVMARLLLLSEDAALRERFGAAGRQFVGERFSTQRMVDDLYALYLRLTHRLNGGAHSRPNPDR